MTIGQNIDVVTHDLLKVLLEAIDESNKIQVTLVANFEHQKAQVARMQDNLDWHHSMLFEDKGGKQSIQTTLARMDDRLRQIEGSYRNMSKVLLAIGTVLVTTAIIWTSSQFFDLVIHTRVIPTPKIETPGISWPGPIK